MAFVLISAGCQDPPLGSLNKAKRALEQAAKVGSLRYAEKTYRTAEKLVQSGWMEMGRQNGRLAPFRDYKKADSILNLAYSTASQATKETQDMVANLRTLTDSEWKDLYQELINWRDALNGALARYKAEHYWNEGELSYHTAERLLLAGEFDEARAAVAKGRQSLRQMAALLAETDNDGARKIGVWRRWIQETLDESRVNGTYAVIVDKSKHTAYLVRGGRLVKSYDCELGYNSAYQKLFSGDGATPEGKYRVSVDKGHDSKYYKALLLNYPNANDRMRFQENKEKGIISRRARIGGLIEIHGEGGRNKDWTEGCVALTNRDIDHLMQFVTTGTPVTIVRRSDLWP